MPFIWSLKCRSRPTNGTCGGPPANARLLTEHTGARAIPVVAGVRYDNEIRQPIDDGEIIWFQTDDEP